MPYEHQDNTGSLWKNDDKQGQQPDMVGSCCVLGKHLRVVGWRNETKQGKKYLRLKFSDPDKRSFTKRSNEDKHISEVIKEEEEYFA